MAAPPVPPAGPGNLLRERILRACVDTLRRCLGVHRRYPHFDLAGCINEGKNDIKVEFAAYQGMHGIDINGLVDNFEWDNHAQGGKRKRRTRHRKRFHKKNRTRRHRRVR